MRGSGGLGLLSLLMVASATAAPPWYVSVGAEVVQIWGRAPGTGWGGEATAGYIAKSRWGAAALLQRDWLDDESTQLAVGGQVFHSGLGVELAWARRDSAPGAARQTTQGVQVGPFISLGVIHLAGRLILAVDDGGHGHQYGIALGFKLPLGPGLGRAFELRLPH